MEFLSVLLSNRIFLIIENYTLTIHLHKHIGKISDSKNGILNLTIHNHQM
jgi:hypothetical protein